MKPVFFRSSAEFRQWLEKNHAAVPELLVGFHRKSSNRGITYREALDEALSFGWIDGVRRRIDEESYSIRFTPRTAGSVWSLVNTKRAEELIAAGKLMPPGLRAFRERDAGKTRQYSYEREHAVLDSELEGLLRSKKRAAAFFMAQPPGYRKIVTHWIMSAKRAGTRERRLAHLIECCEKDARINLLKPDRKK